LHLEEAASSAGEAGTTRTALVTGAAGGIGKAIVDALLDDGCHVIAVDGNGSMLEKLRQDYPVVDCIEADLGSCDEFESLRHRTGAVDILVNCAGRFSFESVLEVSLEELERSFRVNAIAPALLIKAYAPAMIEQRWGSIINISSIAALDRQIRSRAAYASSKAALLGLTKSVALDLVESGVRCNAICPGTIETSALTARIESAADPVAERQRYLRQQPGGRLGDPREIGRMVSYLAGPRSTFVTGSIFAIDGGMSL
jgi:2-keto-3-deoxy-L-fuconate dehydrogenase